MADISASMVMDLRQRTGLGMMECKKALTDAAGDLARAEELLRVKSGAKASKASGRITAEGIIGAYLSPDAQTGSMVEVNCETDFVSRSEDFIAYARKLAHLIAERSPADAAELGALPLESGTVESARQALVQKIGENVSVRRFVCMNTKGKLAQYLHGGGRIGVTVELQGGSEQTGKDVAMHIAAGAAPGAQRPLCIARDQVPPELIVRERDVYTAQAAASGKPADIVSKMVEGRINKYLAEVTLLGQPFVKNPDETVDHYLKANGAAVHRFELYVVGEGIEKRKDDFAAEVAAMTKA